MVHKLPPELLSEITNFTTWDLRWYYLPVSKHFNIFLCRMVDKIILNILKQLAQLHQIDKRHAKVERELRAPEEGGAEKCPTTCSGATGRAARSKRVANRNYTADVDEK
ncbi:hypothetical protein niasHT_029557 [Heterodera trifolii]|uniref:F-box domain-containing protein n=1 Tax=Heterodera trifolii TaxID=157864 RepID=A0ABD2JB01_9BILA